jgi:uncharacterized protein (TIRG00374 family)
MKDIRGKLIIGGFIGAAVVIVLLLYSDLQDIGTYARQFPPLFLIPILGLTLFNYAGRWLKWQFYLNLIDVKDITYRESILLWVSGFVLAITPGKVGEFLKAGLLRNLTGTPVARSAPVIFAERLTDGLAMFVLAAIGFGGILATSTANQEVLQSYVPGYIAVLTIIALGIIALQIRPLCLWGLGVVERLPVVGRFGTSFLELYESTYTLLKPFPLLVAVVLGTISWSGEVIGFFLIFWGMGLEPSWLLLWQAMFILASATIIGAVSGLPGGLGAAEVTVVGMVQLIVLGYADPGFAGAATLFVRLSTLWFSVVLGLVVAFLSRKILFPPKEEQLWRADHSPESSTMP